MTKKTKTKQKYKIFSVRLTLEDYNKLESLKESQAYSTKTLIIARLINQEFERINKKD